MELISRKEAKAQGLPRYYTGKPCLRGHVSERRRSTKQCCACITERQQTPEHKAKETKRSQTPKRKAQAAAYHQTPEAKRKAKEYRQTPEVKEKRISYRQTPEAKAKVKERNRVWSIANPLKKRAAIAAWVAANKERTKVTKAAAGAQRRAAKLQRTPKWLTKADKAAIKALYEQANFMSRVCGEPMHVDHIYPLQGETVSGLHVPLNLQILTATENVTKSNKLLEQFA